MYKTSHIQGTAIMALTWVLFLT